MTDASIEGGDLASLNINMSYHLQSTGPFFLSRSTQSHTLPLPVLSSPSCLFIVLFLLGFVMSKVPTLHKPFHATFEGENHIRFGLV